MQTINWITGHWQQVVEAAGGIVMAARLVVKLTPTPKDDSILESIINAVKHIGLHINPSDKQ